MTLDPVYLDQCFVLGVDGSLTWKRRPREHFTTQRGWRMFNRMTAGKTADASGFVTLGGDRVAVKRIVFALQHGYDREPVRRYGVWIFPRPAG